MRYRTLGAPDTTTVTATPRFGRQQSAAVTAHVQAQAAKTKTPVAVTVTNVDNQGPTLEVTAQDVPSSLPPVDTSIIAGVPDMALYAVGAGLIGLYLFKRR